MPISPPSANLDHIINTLKWATLLSLHLSPFLAPGTTYFYLFEKMFFISHLAEVHHGTVDVDAPVLLVPLDAVEVPASRLVQAMIIV